jgi:hypothetical protein
LTAPVSLFSFRGKKKEKRGRRFGQARLSLPGLKPSVATSYQVSSNQLSLGSTQPPNQHPPDYTLNHKKILTATF